MPRQRSQVKAGPEGRLPSLSPTKTMAATTDVLTVNITVNDIEIAVPKGELVVEAVKRIGLEVPIFCYHPRMKPVGMCRMCLVEVGTKQPDGTIRKMPKPQAACTMPCSEGLAIYTDSEAIHKDRRGVLEFLLINHPLDCPICDRGGECPLQNNTLFYGPSTSRYVEMKRHLPKHFPLGKYVTLDLERCIQCGRCVRFTEEISGDSQLAFRFRGAEMQPTTFELTDFDSKFSGNVIEICPVGALTSTEYRFRARPWDLETKPAICTVCSNGCSVWFDHRVSKLVRINGRTNDAVNEEWTCDRGKFGHEFYNSETRLAAPLVRASDRLAQTGWAEAYGAILEGFKAGGDAVAAIVAPTCSNEDLFALKKLFNDRFQSDNVDHRFETNLPKIEPANPAPTPIADYESAPAVLVFGTSLADEEPILYLRLRKAWSKNGAKIVVVSDRATEVESFAEVAIRYEKGSEVAILQALVDGKTAVSGVDPKLVERARALLLGTATRIVATRGIYDLDRAEDVFAGLKALATSLGSPLNVYARESNGQGALDLGILPGPQGLDTHGILEACAAGKIKALWLVGCDPFARVSDRDLVQKAMESVEFLVVQDIDRTEVSNYASVVLPMTAPAESEGTFTNLERRVQRIGRILSPRGDAKPAWKIFSEVSLRMHPETPRFNASEVMAQIAAETPSYASVSYDALPPHGLLLR